MTLSKKLTLSGLVALFLFASFVFAAWAVAEVNFSEQTQANSYQNFNFFTGGGSSNLATTTNATSTQDRNGGLFKIAGARQVELYFSRGDTTGQGNSGSSLFRIQVTQDGITWLDYSDLTINAITAGANLQPRVGTSSISAATSTVIAKMNALGFYAIRCIVVETTDGEHTCKASAEF